MGCVKISFSEARVEEGGLRCWHWVKCALGIWGELQRGTPVLALDEPYFEGIGGVKKGD